MAVVEEENRMRLVEEAKAFLRDRGFDILGSFQVGKSADSGIVAMSKRSAAVVAAAVLDAGKMTSIPLDGFGSSRAAKARAERFGRVVRGEVAKALGWTLPSDVKPSDYRCDVLWIDDGSGSRGPSISHGMSIRI